MPSWDALKTPSKPSWALLTKQLFFRGFWGAKEAWLSVVCRCLEGVSRRGAGTYPADGRGGVCDSWCVAEGTADLAASLAATERAEQVPSQLPRGGSAGGG